MRLTGRGIAVGCGIVLFGLFAVLGTDVFLPVTDVDSFNRFLFVGGATGIPYSFGVLVGVSCVYHSARRGRFVAISGAASAIALAFVYLMSGTPSIFSTSAKSVTDYLFPSVIAVWGFLPLLGLFFGILAVTVGRPPETPGSGDVTHA